MTGPITPPTPPARDPFSRLSAVLGLAALTLGLAGLAACGLNRGQPPTPGDDKGKEVAVPSVGSIPLFGQWPKDRKPDAVVLLSGETFGFLQPCGCTRPQKGGIERRAEFVNSLRARGWPVVGFDLGDVFPDRHEIGPSRILAPPEQTLLKYKTTMNALREMGYVAVGLGKTEFAAGVYRILGEYSLQKEQPPFVLAGNLEGVAGGKQVPREEYFRSPEGSKRPLVGLAEVADVGGVAVGVAGVVGTALWDDAKKLDPSIAFQEKTKTALDAAVAGLAAHPRKPQLNVLLYQGSLEHAKHVAADYPQFQVILCRSEDSEPPQFPEYVGGPNHPAGQKTMIVWVGHKGRYVGVVGAFKKAGGGYDLKYQLVPMGEEFVTPGDEEAARKANPILPLLQGYAAQVRDRKFLAKVQRSPHPAQIQEPKLNLSYIGSEKCQGCHAAQHAKWQDTPHGHALEALEKRARRPTLRQFDGECVVCHTVGFGYNTGYEDEKKTPELMHVGCESCHGPGSGHAANPKDAGLLALQSPWKKQPADRLPDAAFFKKMADLNPIDQNKVPVAPAQKQVINAVWGMCQKCHDHENDPNFDLYKNWPKINHTFGKR